MERVWLALNLGDVGLNLALAFAPAHGIARPDIDLIRAKIGAGEVDREPLTAQAIDWKPGVAPAVAASLDIHGSVGLLHRFTLNSRVPPGDLYRAIINVKRKT